MNITFVGGGNMATALIGGMLKKGWTADAIRVVDSDPAARDRLARVFRVQVHADLASGVAGAECILLAVKPQQLQAVARALAPLVADALVLTIAAGIRVSALSRWLDGHSRIVRAMPNTPALVLCGMTGLYAAPVVTQRDRTSAEQILGVAGTSLWVDREDELDGITAVSGSGPAYVFYFIEALQQAATELGFDEGAARSLALQTFSGSVKLAVESNEPVAELRVRVTSKGGTTERALSELERNGVRAAIVSAVHAAAEHSRELGDALGKDATGGAG